jgi:hypothetical protein
MVMAPKYVVQPAAIAVLCLIAAAGVTIAGETPSAGDSGMGKPTGPIVNGDRATPKRLPTFSGGQVKLVDPKPMGGSQKEVRKTRETFAGAWFADQPSLAAGEKAIRDDLKPRCTHGAHLTDLRFLPYRYVETNYYFWKSFTAYHVGGIFECET